MNVTGGDTNVSAYFDLVLLTGGDATGLTATDFDLTYTRNGAAPSTKVDATAGTAGGAAAHSDNTIVEPDPTDAPGMWRVDFPDAAFAAGVKTVVLTVKHTSIKTANKEVNIDAEVNVTQVAGTTQTAGDLATLHATTQDLVNALTASSGGSVNIEATEDNTAGAIIDGVTFVGSVQGATTFANTEALDGVYHDIDDTGNDIDIVYGFDVGADRVSTSMTFNGFVQGTSDEMQIEVYDHVGADWEVIGTIEGTNGTTNTAIDIPLLLKHTGTGAEAGKTYIRFDTNSTTPSNLSVDQLLISAVTSSALTGFVGGSVWVDTNNGTSGIGGGVGTITTPSDNIDDALTIASNNNLTTIMVAANSSITPTASIANLTIKGQNYSLALNGQSVASSQIIGATLSGTFVGTTGIFENCIINAITGAGTTMRSCYFNDITITANAAGDWFMNDCRSRVAGSGSPNFDFGVGIANTSVSLRAYSGGIEIENMGDTGTDSMSMEGDGALTVNANCDGGSASIRGNIRITDNSAGNVALTITPDVTGYQDGAVWVDEAAGTSSGSVTGIDGTMQNQSDDFDNAQDIADDLGTSIINLRAGNSITLTDTLQGYTINNVQVTLNGGSQNVDSTRINGGFVTGTFARAGTGVPTFNGCSLLSVTADRVAILNNSGIVGTLTLTEAGLYPIVDAQAGGPTGIATIDFASLGGATVNMEGWKGSLTIANMASGDTLNLHAAAGGDIVLGGADGTVTITGVVGTVTDNRTGSPTLTNNGINLVNINAEADTAISDAFTFTQAGNVDANIKYVNEVEVDGTGAEGDEWGPA